MTTPTPPQPTTRWQIWVIALGDYLRDHTGEIQLFTDQATAQQTAQEVGGIVQVDRAPGLGGFDRAQTR